MVLMLNSDFTFYWELSKKISMTKNACTIVNHEWNHDF